MAFDRRIDSGSRAERQHSAARALRLHRDDRAGGGNREQRKLLLDQRVEALLRNTAVRVRSQSDVPPKRHPPSGQ